MLLLTKKNVKGVSAVSAGHDATLKMAKEILRMGGNAFDASISAHLTMYLAEPCMASAGAGGFAMCYKPDSGVKMLDFFTQTPIKKQSITQPDFYPIKVNFGNETEEFHLGAASMATPGSIAGLFEIHKMYGSLPMEALIDPVIDLAKNGVALDEFQYIDMGLLEPILKSDPSVRNIFFKDGELKKVGEIIYMPHYVDFLDFLKKEGRRGFYEGEVGQKVAEYSHSKGGFLTRQDFENYQATWRQPLSIEYRGKTLFVPNGPSMGGAILLVLLANLQTKQYHKLEAIEKTLKQCHRLDNIDVILKSNYPNLNYHRFGDEISSKGTSHFNIMDKDGNAIAFTCSLGEGAGYFIPGTDMQMNNMLGESFLLPNGFHSWSPDTRLNSMMTPTLILNSDEKPVFVTGSGGAGRIPYMILQVIERYFNDNLSLEKATKAPRIYLHDKTVHFEEGFEIDTEQLKNIRF